MSDLNFLLSRLRCPDCHTGNLVALDAENLLCQNCAACFPLTSHRPILLRHDNALFSIDDYRTASPLPAPQRHGFERFIPSPSVNLAYKRVLGCLRQTLDKYGPVDILVIGGGRQRVWLDPLLRASQPHRVIYSDIDAGADVDLFCDAHDLPFFDGTFDAVITTAVLELVIYPERVAAEIARVLKSGGLLYSEIPFIQQVHGGAYDFTRYTLSGHRRLFNHFAEIDAGMVAGPATALVWALENLALAFTSRETTRKLTKAGVRFAFGWIKHLDRMLVHRPAAMDGASCTYFFGSKIDSQVSDADIIAGYVGAKHWRHI